ncbi:MAG TPA: hypothetical protein VIO33_05200 [Burkholderiaceae bacterium]
MRLRSWLAVLAAFGMAACGGGGSDGTTGTSAPSGTGSSNVSVRAATSASAIPSGGSTTIELTVANAGPDAASNVSLNRMLASTLIVDTVSCTASGGATCPANVSGPTIDIGTLPANGSLVFTVTATVTKGASGDLASAASVSASNDGTPADNTATFQVKAYSADVSVSAINPDVPVVGGGTATYAMSLGNAGPDTALDVHLTISSDADQTLRTVTCTATGAAVCPSTLGASFVVPNLPKDSRLTFAVSTNVGTGALGAKNATMTALAAGDPASANDTGTASTVAVAPNVITLQSDTGDYIGGGRTYEFTRTNTTMNVSSSGGHLSIALDGDQWWNGNFVLPGTYSKVQVGTYTGLTRYPFSSTATGGLDWSGDGRGCNTLNASLSVTHVVYEGTELKEVDLNFEQHCEGVAAALHGQVHWTAYDNTMPPGPVSPPPAGLWTPPAGITPTSGNYVYLQSDLGDYIGGGGTYLYTPSNATLTPSGSGGRFSIAVNGAQYWYGDFQAMIGLALLQPGYYGDLQRYPFENPAKGGISWWGNGNGCNTLKGWFIVDAVSYSGVTLTSIDLRFEQHCEGFGPALHGAIHWSAN